MSTETDSSNVQKYNENTLNTINQLQSLENELYAQLEDPSVISDLQKQTDIKNKISNISNTRVSLLNNLSDMHNMTQNSVINNRNTLLNNLVGQGILQTELDNLNSNLDILESNKNDKLKMVQINTYYAKRYKAHSELMKKVFIICSVILLIVILDKKGFLPYNIGPLAVIIILVVGIISIVKNVIDLNRRDNLDFDRYKWRSPESKKYETPSTTSEFLEKDKEDYSLCQLTTDIKKSLTTTGDYIKSGVKNIYSTQNVLTSGTEGFNILGKSSSPAPYYSSYN